MAADRNRNDAWSGMGIGWSVTSTMIGGIAAWGGLGFLADRWLGTGHVLFAFGTVLGAAGATYLVWLRYGRGEGGES